MTDTFAVKLGGHPYIGVEAVFHTYQDPAGGPAIELVQGGERLAMVTVNLSQQGERPNPGCIFVKNYSENAGLLDDLVRQGFVEETGRTVYPRGSFESFPEAKLIGDWATEAALVVEADRQRRIEMLRSI